MRHAYVGFCMYPCFVDKVMICLFLLYTAEVVNGGQLGWQSLPAGWATCIELGANSSFWQLPTQKSKTRWAASCASGGLAIGHVFGSPSKTMDACVLWYDIIISIL